MKFKLKLILYLRGSPFRLQRSSVVEIGQCLLLDHFLLGLLQAIFVTTCGGDNEQNYEDCEGNSTTDCNSNDGSLLHFCEYHKYAGTCEASYNTSLKCTTQPCKEMLTSKLDPDPNERAQQSANLPHTHTDIEHNPQHTPAHLWTAQCRQWQWHRCPVRVMKSLFLVARAAFVRATHGRDNRR
jgi:hypothetical protein